MPIGWPCRYQPTALTNPNGLSFPRAEAASERVTEEKAASSQDAQRQMQGQPTAAQQAQGAKPSARTADEGC
jgi:hypothetical protein